MTLLILKRAFGCVFLTLCILEIVCCFPPSSQKPCPVTSKWIGRHGEPLYPINHQNDWIICLPNPRQGDYTLFELDHNLEIDTIASGLGIPYYNQSWQTTRNPPGIMLASSGGLSWINKDNGASIKLNGSHSIIIGEDSIATINAKDSTLELSIYNLSKNYVVTETVFNLSDIPYLPEWYKIEIAQIHRAIKTADNKVIYTVSFVLINNKVGQAFLAVLTSGGQQDNVIRALGTPSVYRRGIVQPIHFFPDNSVLVPIHTKLFKLSTDSLSTIWETELPREMLTSRLFIRNDSLAIWLGENGIGYAISIQHGTIVQSFPASFTPSRLVPCNGSLFYVNNSNELCKLNFSNLDSVVNTFTYKYPNQLSRALSSHKNNLIAFGQDSLFLIDCSCGEAN